MKPKTMILMVVAVVCGLGASYMTSKLLADRQTEAPAEEQVPVLMAKARVPGWTVIKEPEKYFEVKMLPESAVSKKSLRSFDDIKGQRLNKPLDAERAAMQDDLLTKEQRSIIDNLVPGQRLIAVKVNPESLAGGWVLPGVRVDVMNTIRSSDSSARIVLQSMLVAAVDMQDKGDPEKQAMIGQTATLVATPEEATRLSLASALGDLRLLPRSTSDTKWIKQGVVRSSDLDKQYRPSDLKENPDSPSTTPSTGTELPEVPEVKPPVVTTPPPVTEPAPPAEKPRKRHKMKLINGSHTETAVFIEGESDDDDEPTSTPKKEAKPEPKKDVNKEPKKDEAATKPAATPPTTSPKSARIRR